MIRLVCYVVGGVTGDCSVLLSVAKTMVPVTVARAILATLYEVTMIGAYDLVRLNCCFPCLNSS